MDDWCDSGWMNVAQNLETILQICDVLQSADAAKAANAWGRGGIDRFEELICENCDRDLHNYYFAKVTITKYLQNIYGAAQLHNNPQTNSGDGRAEEISSLINSRTCWWDLVYWQWRQSARLLPGLRIRNSEDKCELWLFSW